MSKSTKLSIREIRRILRSKFGARKYRITSDGAIHVYGRIPYTQVTCWYFFGWMGDSQTEARIEGL